MASASPAQETAPSRKTIELQVRFMASEEKTAPAATPEAASVMTSGAAVLDPGLLDPAFDRVAVAKLFWEIDGEAMEIPFRDPGELSEVLEFEYVLNGPYGLKQLVHQLELAIILTLSRSEDLPDPLALADQRAVPEPRNLRFARPSLYARLNGGMGLIDIRHLGQRAAWTDDIIIQLSLPAYIKLLSQADDALTVALESLWKRTGEALRTMEETARGILAMTLDSARNEILREGLRYFRFDGVDGIEAALMSVKRPMAKAQDDARAEKAADVAKMPVHTLPARLQAALKVLKPLAEDLIDKRKAIAKEAQKVNTSMAMRVVPVDRTELTEKQRAEREAAQKVAIETGKLRESHPVALRLSPEEMVKAADAPRDQLGGILFPILAQAYQANKNVRSELKDWPQSVGKIGPWPESGLIYQLKSNPGTPSIWRHRKYIERGLARVFPEQGTLGHAAVMHVLEEVHPDSGLADIAATLVRDTAIFHAAGKIDEKAALRAAAEAGARKLPKLVPILNWGFAAASIYKQVIEYSEGEDLFYCTLDQRDALADVDPSALDLAGGIALEVAFALI